jgi:hypothetical protein
MPRRRSVLQSIGGAVGVAAATGIGTATTGDATEDDGPVGTAGVGNDRQLPVHAAGTLAVRYAEAGDDTYTLHRVFRSDALRERYGDPEFRYEPQTLSEKFVPEEVRDGDRREYSFRTSEVIGTRAEHVTAEAEIWSQASDLGGLDVPTIDGNVPLYQYENGDDAENKQNRGSPFNVAWETKDTARIKDQMKGGKNGPIWRNYTDLASELKVDQYVNLPNSGTKSTDGHVMKHLYAPLCKWESVQYHIRVYDVPFDGIEAIGQAHKDPCYHGHLSEFLGWDVNWKIDSTRDAVVNFWEEGHGVTHETVSVGNTSTDFSSHSGSWAFFDG